MPSEVDLLDKKSHDQDDRGRLMKPRRSSLENEDLESRLIELNAELRRENEKLVRELEELGSQNVEMAFQIGELHEELDRRLQQATRDFESEREQLNNQLLAREDENLTLGGRLQEARREIEDLQGALEEANLQNARLKEESRVLRQENQDLEILQRELEGLREAQAKAGEREQEHAAEIAALNERLAAQESLQQELQESRLRVILLEEHLTDFKRQYLEQLPPTPEKTSTPTSAQGRLARLLEEVLGTTGRVLLEKTRERCSIQEDSTDPEDARRLAQALKDPALRLCRSPEHRQRLESGLAELEEADYRPEEASSPTAPLALPESLEPDPQELPDLADPAGRLRSLLESPTPGSPREQAILALIREGLDPALQAESQVAVPEDPGPEVLQGAIEPTLQGALDYLLDEAMPRSGLTIALPSPEFAAWQADSSEPSAQSPSAQMAHRIAQQVFSMENLQVRMASGEFLAVASRTPEPILLLHQDLEEASSVEVRYLVARELFALHRRHVELSAAVRQVDGRARARLVRRAAAFLIENGAELSSQLLGDTSALWGSEPPERIGALLDEMHRTSPREELRILKEFLIGKEPFKALMEWEADRFALRLCGPGSASAALVRELADPAQYDECVRAGFQALFQSPRPEQRGLRLRLQRIWAGYLA
ncbi:MAG: hypothetical protein ACOX9B_01090 [Candidatus Xenobium sp.]|nr:hypothetical protein [Burkholderiales bacterium]